MKKRKVISTILCTGLMVSSISIPSYAYSNANSNVSALDTSLMSVTSGSTITANTEYINKYTSAKRICGYAKDSSGSPLKNTTVYASFYDSRYSIPSKIIEPNYAQVQTDSNGYYSFFAYNSGYYVVFLDSDTRDITYALIR